MVLENSCLVHLVRQQSFFLKSLSKQQMLCCILKGIQNHNVMNTMNFKGNILSETCQPVTKD